MHPGWFVVAAAAIGVFMTVPGQTVGVAPFVDVLAGDLALPRGTVIALYSFGTLVGILPAPLVGRLVDRYGPRRSIAFVALAVTASCLAVSAAQGPWSLAVGFTLLRGSAIGGLSLVSTNMVSLWFERFRGRATAVAMLGLAVGGLVVPRLAAELAATAGWRTTYVALGVAVALVMVPVGLLFFRDAPRAYGESPDFGRAPAGASVVTGPDRTLAQAVRTTPFWYLVALSVLANAVGTALLLDHVRVLTAAGLGRVDAVALLGAVTAGQGLLTLGGGMLIDRIGVRRAGLAGITVLTLTVACVMTAPSLGAGFAYSIGLGASIGMLQVSAAAGLAEYFGTRHLGAIRGTTFFVGIVGAAAGPLPFLLSPGVAYGSYLAGAAVAMLLGTRFVPSVLPAPTRAEPGAARV